MYFFRELFLLQVMWLNIMSVTEFTCERSNIFYKDAILFLNWWKVQLSINFMILYKVIEQTFKTNNFRYEWDIGNLGFEIMQLPIFFNIFKVWDAMFQNS